MTPEVEFAGIFVSTLVPTALAGFALTILARKALGRLGAYHHIWHPALFVFAVHMIVLPSITPFIAR